jgi:hypothetical protein
MKKIIITILSIVVFCITSFPQISKPAYFIGTYDLNDGKGFMCHDRGLERQDVLDFKEYDILQKAFREKYKDQNPGRTFIAANRAVIIYEYQNRVGGFNCTIKIIAVKEGKDIKSLKEQLNADVTKYPNDYFSKPVIIFEWEGKGVAHIDSGNEPRGTDSATGSSNGKGGSDSGSSENDSNAGGTNLKSCPTYGFKLSNSPSYNCAAISWWSLSTKVNAVDASGNFKQSSDPEAKFFTIQFRKQGDLNWIEEKSENNGKNVYTLSGLDACTKYEVRLITTCDNNQVSVPTNIIKFTTACTKPGNLSVENITNNSVKVNSQRLTAKITYPCSSNASTQIRIIEYKTNTSNWQQVICNSGSPCLLDSLIPNTIYKVRARYKYGNNLFSNYTNEIAFTTQP